MAKKKLKSHYTTIENMRTLISDTYKYANQLERSPRHRFEERLASSVSRIVRSIWLKIAAMEEEIEL